MDSPWEFPRTHIACQPGCQDACKPHNLGQVSEPPRTWSSSCTSLACPKGVRRGREQAVTPHF